MAKYLFLLGFFLFSISFLSTPVIADGYAAKIYKGLMYKNQNDRAINCANKKEMKKRLTSLIAAKEDREKADIPVGYCQEGGFKRFILFEEVEGTGDFKFVRSFISPKAVGNGWKEAYLEMRTDIQILRCDVVSNLDEQSSRECASNLAMYDEHKIASDPFNTIYRRRSPDSIKE